MLDTTNIVVDIDLDSFTFGEAVDVEDIIGIPINEAVKHGVTWAAKTVLAVTFVTLRRDHPELTLDDVKALKVAILNNTADNATDSKVVAKKVDVSKSISKKD